MVGLLPDGSVQPGIRRAGPLYVALTYKWATHSHQNKPKDWVIARYFGEFHKSWRDRGSSVTATAAPI